MIGLKYIGSPTCCVCGDNEVKLLEYSNAMGQPFFYCQPCVEIAEENEEYDYAE